MFKRSRRTKKTESRLMMELIWLGLLAAGAKYLWDQSSAWIHSLATFAKSRDGVIAAASLVMASLFLASLMFAKWSRKRRKQKQLQTAIQTLTPSSDREDYLIENDDYRRGNPKENYYRKVFALRLFEAFGNCCAKCGDNDNGVDIDHFMLSKNEGGSFILRHRDGFLVNNAIPLCQSCNRSKSDRSFQDFFTEEQLVPVLERNVVMTKLLNARAIFDEGGELVGKKRAA